MRHIAESILPNEYPLGETGGIYLKIFYQMRIPLKRKEI
jgi:hypothetical protein